MHKRQIAIGVLLGSALFSCLSIPLLAGREESVAREIRDLVRDLGAPQFSVRNRAEEQLKQRSRSILPFLMEYRHTDDPEVYLRINRAIDYLMSPAKIPQSVWLFDCNADSDFESSMQTWRREGVVDADQFDMNDPAEFMGNYESIAQSFVPCSTNIAAVEIGVYPLRQRDEWFRVEIREDARHTPGRYVLTRAWVRVDDGLPKGQMSSLAFDVPDVVVSSNQTYWIVYTAVRGPACRAVNFSPVRLSRQNSPERGPCLVKGYEDQAPQPSPGGHLRFRVLTTCGPAPLLREAATNEARAVPDAARIDAAWDSAIRK